MKINYFLALLFLANISIAQETSYIDSLDISIKTFSKEKQLEEILKIPYDKFIGNISKSEVLLNEGVMIANEINDSLSLADVYQKLSTLYAYKDNREKKIEYAIKSINIYEEIREIDKAGVAYGKLGYTIKHENREKAFLYMRKSIRLLEQGNNKKLIDHIYDNYGVLLLINKKIDSAIYYHNKSLLIKKKLNDSIGLGYTYAHLGTAYSVLKKQLIAKKFIDSSTIIRRKLNDIYGIAVNYTHTADINFNEGKFKEAILNFKSSATLAKKNSYQHLEKYCYEYIANSYIEIKDYKNAYKYNIKYQSLKDSVLNEQTNKKIAELEVEFETEKKEKEIAEQKEELLKQKLEIKNKNLFAVLLAAGLLILGLILYLINKKKEQLGKEIKLKDELSKTKTQNKLQEQRLHISRDLHDNIGSQLTFIISSIDNLKFLTKSSDNKLKTKLTNINNFATNTISQLRDTIWAMNKNEIPYDDFYGRVLGLIEKAKLAKSDIKYNLKNEVKSNIIFSSVNGINIYRVLQESINNTLKYADASQINIHLSEDNNDLNISIKDNGKGFDIHTIEFGNGLNNMQHRIEEINGEIDISSEKNKGTSINIRINKNTTNVV